MTVPYTLGRRKYAYYNTGSYGSPVWVKVARTKDLTNESTLETVDASDSDTDYNLDVPVALQKTISYEINRDNSQASYLALESAHDNMTTLDMIFITGPVTTPGNRGLRATVSVSKFSEKFPLKGIQAVDVEHKPAPSDNAPTRFVS